jgi:hypothetical protein
MNIYSIVRIGDAYVVRAGETGVLKVASRRRALRLVSDAKELLAVQAATPLSQQTPTEPSIARDAAEVP